LHIQGDSTFDQNTGGQLAIRGSTNTNNRLNIGFDTTGNYAWLQAITSGTSHRNFCINPAGGNVGIGTDSPTTVLAVQRNGSGTFITLASGDSTTAGDRDVTIAATKPGVARHNLILDAHQLYFNLSNSERARIDSSGRLLVGTSSARSSVITGSTYQAQLQLEAEAAGGIATSRFTTGIQGQLIAMQKARGSIASPLSVADGDTVGTLVFSAYDGTQFVNAGFVRAEVDGTPGANDMPGRLVFSVTADGAASPTEALRISNNRAITVSDGGNVVLGTTTGTKIGTATTQKLGFYNATPVVQPVAVADATDAASAISQLNALLAHMRTLGLIAT
jgi:hypothetical protein